MIHTFCQFFIGIGRKELSICWRVRHYSGSVCGSLGPINNIQISYWFHNWEIYTLSNGAPTWSFSLVGWMHRCHIRKHEACHRSVVYLSIGLWHFESYCSWWRQSYQVYWYLYCFKYRIPALVLLAGTLSSPSLGLFSWSIPPCPFAWGVGSYNHLVSDPFFEQVFLEGSGGIFTSIVGPECLHSMFGSVLHFG